VKKDSIIKHWTQPDKLKEISELAGFGYTDKGIAERMGISPRSFYRYRLQSPELDEAVRNGKEIVDYKVESALLKAALGYTTKEVKVIGTLVDGKLVKTVQEETTKEYPPNVLACQVWLYNRQRDKWKRNRDNEITVYDDKAINITITRAEKEEE